MITKAKRFERATAAIISKVAKYCGSTRNWLRGLFEENSFLKRFGQALAQQSFDVIALARAGV